MEVAAILQAKVNNYTLHFGRESNVEQLEFVERNFAFQEYYITTTLMLSGVQLVKQYTKEGFIDRLDQAFQRKEGVTLTDFVKVDPVNRVVVWRGFYTADSPISSPYYEFTMHFTEDNKIRLNVIRQLQTEGDKPKAKEC